MAVDEEVSSSNTEVVDSGRFVVRIVVVGCVVVRTVEVSSVGMICSGQSGNIKHSSNHK